MKAPLENIRVLDLTRLLPGPLCTLFLADLGAEVIKVEDTNMGDYVRWLPPLLDEYGAVYHSLNRNKKSLRLDLKSVEGREIFIRLVKDCDVLVEGFRPGTLDKLGIGYALLTEKNPKLIYCAITGYGQEGPYRDKAGHDINYISIAGVLGATGVEGGPPGMPGVQIADIGGGSILALSAILLALFQRERTDKGQFLDVSMMDGSTTFLMHHISESYSRGIPFRRGGERLTGGLACYFVYRTKDDRYLSVGALEPKFWANLLGIIGREDLIEKQFIEDEQPAIKKELQKIFLQKTRDEWLEVFKNRDVCVEPVYELNEVEKDPQIRYRRLFRKLRLKNGKESIQIMHPIRGTEIPEAKMNPAPAHGEHTDEILRGIGYNDSEIKELRKKGVI